VIQQLLPNDEVFEDFLHPDLAWGNIPFLPLPLLVFKPMVCIFAYIRSCYLFPHKPDGERKMQLDIWIPKYNLALEYQGDISPFLSPFPLLLPPPLCSYDLRPSYPSTAHPRSLLCVYPTLLFSYTTGEHHYFDLPSRDGPGGTISVLARDQKKKEKCARVGITLVHIPYWYD
jgi:hypothetical protein